METNKTNHDWQEKALENIEKAVAEFKQKLTAEKYPATELVKEIDRLIPQDTLVKESPETLRGKDCITHWDGQCNATCYPDVHS